MRQPVASIQRLQELGLDKAVFGSCSGITKKAPGGPFSKVINRGCRHHPDSGGECKWAGTMDLIQPREQNDTYPRPRNVATRIVKPSVTREGDEMRENYCSCVQWHDDLARRDGLNKNLCDVIGGEGDSVVLRTSRVEKDASGATVYIPERKSTVVPRFPDPTDVPDLAGAVDAGRVRLEVGAKKRRDEREARIGPAFVATERGDSELGEEATAVDVP
jgi:hypothetical protein